MQDAILNLLPNKDLNPSLKLTLIGINNLKKFNDDGSIIINLDSITQLTAINNRGIRRNLKLLDEKHILKIINPSEVGKFRKLLIQPKYNELLGTQYSIATMDNLSTSKIPSTQKLVLDKSSNIKNSSKSVLELDKMSKYSDENIFDTIPNFKELTISKSDICRNPQILNEVRNNLKDNDSNLKWVDLTHNSIEVISIEDCSPVKILFVTDEGKKKYVIKNML